MKGAAVSESAEPSFSAREFLYYGVNVPLPEIGPHFVGKIQFRIRRLPHQKVRYAALGAGTDDDVRFRASPGVKSGGNIVFGYGGGAA